MDVWSEALRRMRVRGTVLFTAEMRAPWGVASPTADVLARALRVRSGEPAMFHLVTEGEVWVRVRGGARRLRAGDALVVPRGDAHVLSSHAAGRAVPLTDVLALESAEAVRHVSSGGAGAVARLVCGFLIGDVGFRPLVDSLPTLIHLRTSATTPGAGAGRAQADRRAPQPDSVASEVVAEAHDWLGISLRRLAEETSNPSDGPSPLADRLLELLFVEAARCSLAARESVDEGVTPAVRQASLARTLRAIHAQPARAWTVEELARIARSSRSAYADRFTREMGMPPGRYLVAWRMHRARELMRGTDLSLAQVAERVGYASETGFHRAFKRLFGETPAAWRASRRSAASGSGAEPDESPLP